MDKFVRFLSYALGTLLIVIVPPAAGAGIMELILVLFGVSCFYWPFPFLLLGWLSAMWVMHILNVFIEFEITIERRDRE